MSIFTKWFPLFPLMFFASTPAITDAGGGADQGGGDAGAATEEVSDSGDDQGGDSADDAGISDESGQTDSESGQDESGERADTSRDGRTLPANVRQALSKLREIDPKAADVVRREYYLAGDYKQVFGTVNAARQARDLIDEAGGSEGIQELRGDADDYAAELRAMAEGNPQAIEDLAADFPEGLVKLTPLAIDKLRQVNPERYEHLRASIVSETFRDFQVSSHLARVVELIQDGKQQAALDKANDVLKWTRGVDEYAKSKPAPKDGESDGDGRFREREAELDRRERAQFGNAVGRQAIEAMHTEMDVYLKPLLKNLKLGNEQMMDLRSGIRTEVSNGLAARRGYKEKVQSFIDRGDEQGLIRFLRGQYKLNDLVKKSVDRVWQRRGFSGQRRATSQNGSKMQVRSGSKPQPDQIDWSKDRDRTRYALGEATLKDGRVVKWNWDSV